MMTWLEVVQQHHVAQGMQSVNPPRKLYAREAWERVSRQYQRVFEAQMDLSPELPDAIARLIFQLISLGLTHAADIDTAFQVVAIEPTVAPAPAETFRK